MTPVIKFKFPITAKIISCKNVRHKISREITVIERVILDLASFMEKITAFEVTFTVGLKTIMRDYVENALYDLFQAGYLKIMKECDLHVVEANFHRILKEIYGAEMVSAPETTFSSCDELENNRLSFTRGDIEAEMRRVLDRYTFIYQYMLTDKGQAALASNQVEMSDDEGVVNFCSFIMRNNDGEPGLVNLLLGVNELPNDTQLKPVDAQYNNAILKLLKNSSSFLKDGNLKVDVISLTPSTEIKQQDTDGYLILDYSFDNALSRVSVEGKMNKFNIRDIIEKNRGAFEHLGIDESDLEQYIVDLLADQSQVVDSVETTDDGVNITINSMDFGKNDVMIQKIVEMYDKYSLMDFFDKDNNCSVSFLAKIIPDTNDVSLLREYLSYIIKQRFLESTTSCSINQIKQWLEMINQKVKDELIDATDEMAQEISDWLSTNENILIVDEEISEYLNENCPIISKSDAKLRIVEQGNLYRAFKMVDQVDFEEIKEAESRWFNGNSITIQVDDKPEIKFTTTLVPLNEDDLLLLLAKEVSSRHAQFTFETIDDVKRHVQSIIDSWRVLTSKAGDTWDVPVPLSEFTSGTKSFEAFLNKIESMSKYYRIFSIEIQRSMVEMNTHLASMPVQVSLSEPSNENLKEGSFDLYYQISAADALVLADSDASLKKVKNKNVLTSFLYHSSVITQNVSDQGSLTVNLHRVIKSEDADKTQIQKAIIHLFYKASSKSIKKLSRQAIIIAFSNYLSEYNDLARAFIPGSTVDYDDKELNQILITELKSLGFEFQEQKIAELIKAELQVLFNIENIYLSKEKQDLIVAILDPTTFGELKKDIAEKPMPFKLQGVTKSKIDATEVFFVPKFQASDIDNTPYIQDYLALTFNQFLLVNNYALTMRRVELLSRLVEFLTEIHGISEKSIGRPTWDAKKIAEKITSNPGFFSSKQVNIDTIDDIILTQLLEKDIIKQLGIVKNKNKINISADNQITIILSKNELKKLLNWDSVLNLVKKHDFEARINGKKMRLTYSFVPIDPFAAIDFIAIDHASKFEGKPTQFIMKIDQDVKKAAASYSFKIPDNVLTEKNLREALSRYQALHEKK